MPETGSDGTPAREGGAAEGTPLDALRDILVSEERRRLDDLEARLTDPARRAHDVGEVLPAAVSRSAHHGPQLAASLTPTIEDALGAAVRRDPRTLADALFPVMGPAIRKAITSTLAEFVQAVNQALEHSFTLRGLSWRIEALRTGRSFGEVVLRHTLLYRVEQVFLIHRETGLLLEHVTAPAVASQSPDMVSGMLTAIQDFVRDSFGGGTASLESLRIGELTVWVEQSTGAVLAVVLRGTPPETLRTQVHGTLRGLQAELAGELSGFAGDAAPFGAARPALEALLQEQVAQEARGRRSRAAAITAVLTVALLLLAIALDIRASRRWDRFLRALQAEPGIALIRADRHRLGLDRVSGLRDGVAVDPAQLALAAGVDTADLAMAWQGYASTEPLIRRRRAARAADSLASRIVAITVRFALGSSRIPADQAPHVAAARRDLEALMAAAAEAGLAVRVVVRGQTDSIGAPDVNAVLGRARAEAVLAALSPGGPPPSDFAVVAEGDTVTARDRLVSFTVSGATPAPERRRP